MKSFSVISGYEQHATAFQLMPLKSNKNVGRITGKRTCLKIEISCILV